MKDTPQEILFNYLRDMIYKEEIQPLELAKLPEEFRDLGRGLELLSQWLSELKRLSTELSNGQLDIQMPDHNNVLAGPLKALHATMKHITWQAQQISKGDYSQRIDYMGEFSEAFNSMVRQLSDRNERLEQSRDDAIKTKELFQKVTDDLESYVIIIADEGKRELYRNNSFKKLETEHPLLSRQLKASFEERGQKADKTEEKWEAAVPMPDENTGTPSCWYFLIERKTISWDEQPAEAYIITDISEKRYNEQKMEEFAFYDALTGLHNRHYIMQLLDKWIEESTAFCLTFIDLDNLKYANDEFGHEEGDRYIRQAAGLLSQIQGNTEVARIGGDEFLLLVRGTSEELLKHELEEARNTFSKMEKKKGYIKSFSYGVVYVSSFGSRHRSAILREADRRMYEYKMLNKPRIKKDGTLEERK